MTPLAALSLFAVMLGLAALPSASVALVVARSATLGTANGAATALGIVLGDLIFAALAILGMSVLAEVTGSFFSLLKYASGAYLVFLGVSLIRSNPGLDRFEPGRRGLSLLASFVAGFTLTLGDVKAILFYASLFPAFVDLGSLAGSDLVAIAIIIVTAVGGVKFLYVLAARHIALRLQNRSTGRAVRKTAGALMIGSGAWLVFKA